MRLALLAEAEAELDDAASWYDDRSEGLGDEFLDVAREALTLIRESPETWPLWPKAPARIPPIRRFLLPRFPYALAYQKISRCARHPGCGARPATTALLDRKGPMILAGFNRITFDPNRMTCMEPGQSGSSLLPDPQAAAFGRSGPPISLVRHRQRRPRDELSLIAR